MRIVSGIEEGDRVATTNLADLYDGVEVAIDTSAPAESQGLIMQKLAEICIDARSSPRMLIAAITAIGGVSFFTLGVDRYPRVETPWCRSPR